MNAGAAVLFCPFLFENGIQPKADFPYALHALRNQLCSLAAQHRKEGEHKHPVHCDISVDTWQKYASPVWMDIDYSNTLNSVKGRDENDEKHICPLQLPTIERAITLWSNKGDTVLTPFLGIGSEVYQSIKLGRFGIGFELKESYFNEAIKNCRFAEMEKNQKQLFDAV